MMWSDPMFPEKNALPGSQHQSSGGKGDDFTAPGQSHFDVTGHIIRPFVGVDEFRMIVGNQFIHKHFKVPAGGRVRILHQNKATAGMLYKYRRRSGMEPTSAQCILNFAGNFQGALASGGYGECFLIKCQCDG